ncbi:hypothetical protein QBC45DRAFT_96349 [Copromyces sp. CBS 386.78]|nr:hypothetical protein QBC45DRAFT_96349 [Copromyces sp. CBS 386.78]
MTSHQPESCGCVLYNGRRVYFDTCHACAGSMRQMCGYCHDGMIPLACDHGAQSTSAYQFGGAAPRGSGGNGGFNGGRGGRNGGRCGDHNGWAPTSHGHGRAA